MKYQKTKFKNLRIYEGVKFKDSRGYFREIFKNKFLKKKIIFWCMSRSKKNVLRGMHLQTKNPQGKFISVIKGKIFDVVVDCRKKSKTYGKYFSIILSDKNCKSLYIPEGFAHGFLSLSNENLVFYGNTKYREKKHEVTIKWNDKDLSIKWPKSKKIISKKDLNGIELKNTKLISHVKV